MIDNPYKILDIPETATKEEIKKAYRKKAKEYHPDLHPDDPTAAQKMNEVNEAYDMLSNPEKYQRQRQNQNQYTSGYEYYGNRQQRSNQQYYGYGQNRQNYSENNGSYDYDDFDFYDFFGFGHTQREHFSPHRMPDDSEVFRQAVDLINGRAYSYALQSLNGVSSTLRNARWYYLSAIANYGMGNDALAMNQIETAVQMEPENMVYRTVLQRMKRTSGSYNQNGQEYQRYADGLSKFCWSYLFLQLFCMFCRCY